MTVLASRLKRLEQNAGVGGRFLIIQCSDQTEAELDAALEERGFNDACDTLTVIRWHNTGLPITFAPEPIRG